MPCKTDNIVKFLYFYIWSFMNYFIQAFQVGNALHRKSGHI